MPAGGGAKRILVKGRGAEEPITSLSWQALPRSGYSARSGGNPFSFVDHILDAAGRLVRNAAESVVRGAETRSP